MRVARSPGLTNKIIRHPSAVLLVVQLVGVLVYPFMENSTSGRVLFEIFGALVLALAIWSVRESPGPTWIVIVLGVVASSLSIADAVNTSPSLQLASAVLHAVFYFWAAASLMAYMLSDREVTTDELYAVGATFTLVAWGFGYLYLLMQIVQPGCFTAAVDSGAQRSWTELLFLSFTTLTSTGLSDVVPITPHARAVSMIEQLAGVGYVALFVSRVVGLTISRQIIHHDEPSSPDA
jgi:Ion channel